MASTYHKIPIQTLTKAPIPAAFEFLGLVSLYTKNKTSPTTGIQHPKIPHPILPVSLDELLLLSVATPQFGQMTALSSISFPQFLQYIFMSSVFHNYYN
jgi:hypothetical protein